MLGIIASSPTDMQPVLDAIVESAARVCGIDDVLCDASTGTYWSCGAHYGPCPMHAGDRSASILTRRLRAGFDDMERFTFLMSAEQRRISCC